MGWPRGISVMLISDGVLGEWIATLAIWYWYGDTAEETYGPKTDYEFGEL